MNRNLSLDQFSLVHDEDEDTHFVDAYHPSFGNGEQPVGSMAWAKKAYKTHYGDYQPGEIVNIGVQGPTKHDSRSFRGQGLAGRMYEFASNFDPKPLHSNNLTDDGKKWARKMGGPSVA